ncbi:MAG TPA: DUF531 family protein [Candidatus Thermoplasmatota archaeon]|nr:DUF531 family protein [Candidatus Thermoplasmatota archaeon]
MAGRLTLGLYNCYDPKQWHDIMRITLARAAPVAEAFGCHLATFGFPYEQARARGAKQHLQGLDTPLDVARFVAGSTSIGEGAEHLDALARSGRFQTFPFPGPAGFPVALGEAVATTPHPDIAKRLAPHDVAKELAAGQSQLLLFGLGPRGLPAEVLDGARHHLELTGKGISFETATALGALPAMVHTHLLHLTGGAG